MKVIQDKDFEELAIILFKVDKKIEEGNCISNDRTWDEIPEWSRDDYRWKAQLLLEVLRIAKK